MENKRQIIVLLIVAALVAALVAGCGSDSSSSSSSADTTGSSSSSTTTSDGGSSAEFIKPGGKNKVAKFGQEASDSEREAASAVLEENLQARAAGDWAAQCSSLSKATIKKVEEGAAALGGEKGCEKGLEAQAQPVSATKAIRANTMTGPVAVLRVEGTEAFALYHGAKGVDYAMPMNKEGSDWKVGSLVTQELP
jgi:hypothetical protein